MDSPHCAWMQMVSHSDLFCHQIDLHNLSTPAPHEAQVALEGGTESTGVD